MPSGTATAALVLLSESASQTDFDNLIASLEKNNAVIDEQITDPESNFWAFSGDFFEENLMDLDGNDLVDTISPADVEFQNTDFNNLTAQALTPDEAAVASRANLDPLGNLTARALPDDALFLQGTLSGAVGFPFHLEWFNSLWAKNAWEGVCKICHDMLLFSRS
jgi:hypothetical protein